MKKFIILSMLVISYVATAQLNSNQLNYKDNLFTSLYTESNIASLSIEMVEEEDAPFDFNTKAYLPLGFNPYAKNETSIKFEVIIEEEDAPFNFNTSNYLPKGFNPYKGMVKEEKSTL